MGSAGLAPQNRPPCTRRPFILIALLVLPLLIGPEVQGVARWFALGSFSLNSGLTLISLIAVLSAWNEDLGPYSLLLALDVVTFQPDAASTLALTGAAFGLALANRDRRARAIGAVGVFATAWASLTPNLPPQPFVEGVIPAVWSVSPIVAIALALSLIASLALILSASGDPRAPRFTLAGAMAGFVAAALLRDYPAPLIGYGAASIIGLGLALPAIRSEETGT